MDTRTFLVCTDCFYKHRGIPGDIRRHCDPHHSARRVQVYWNYYHGFYETTFVRDLPNRWMVRRKHNVVRLCDPSGGTCRGDNCIFAHGVNEQEEWNMLLQEQHNGAIREDAARTIAKSRQNLQLASPSISGHLQMPSTVNPVHTQSKGSARIESSSSHKIPTLHSVQFKDRVQNELTLQSIQVKLTKETYKDKFCNLVCWEEKRHIEILDEKCNSMCNIRLYENQFKPSWIYNVKEEGKCFGYVKGLNQDQIAYATQASEAAFVANGTLEVKMEILKENFDHCDDNLYIAFEQKDKRLLSQICGQLISCSETEIVNVWVEFEVKHSYFNSLIKAIKYLSPEIIERILPSKENFLRFSRIFYEELDHLMLRPPCSQEMGLDQNQLSSLVKILTCNPTSPPLLINGSFGTGKTRLIAVASHCLVMQGRMKREPVRILICAHHQATVDEMVSKYFMPILQQYHGNFELVRLIPKYQKQLPKNASKKYYKHIYDVSSLYFSQASFVVVATTYLTAISLYSVCGQKYFTHILMDEGSQTREPEAISPLCLASASTKLVIAGDSCQVGPGLLVLGEEARENGLKFSLLERLCSLYRSTDLAPVAQEYILHLSVNYRCNGDIMHLPNSLFYNNGVIPSPSDALSHPKAPYPLVFLCSSLENEVEPWLEARVLLDYLQYLVIENWPYTWGKRNLSDVSILTASRTQLVRIMNVARTEYNKDMKYIAKFPSYAIQGREFRALFISTTEPLDQHGRTTNPTKSLCDKYVFNTVLTRSKSLVVAAGSPFALLRAEQQMKGSVCWRTYINQCVKHDTFFIPQQVESDRKVIHGFLEELKASLYKTVCETSSLEMQYVESVQERQRPISNVPAPKSLTSGVAQTASVQQYPAIQPRPSSQSSQNTSPILRNSQAPAPVSVSQVSVRNVAGSTTDRFHFSSTTPMSVSATSASAQVLLTSSRRKPKKSQKNTSEQKKNTFLPQSKVSNLGASPTKSPNSVIKPILVPVTSASLHVVTKPSEQKSGKYEGALYEEMNTTVSQSKTFSTKLPLSMPATIPSELFEQPNSKQKGSSFRKRISSHEEKNVQKMEAKSGLSANLYTETADKQLMQSLQEKSRKKCQTGKHSLGKNIDISEESFPTLESASKLTKKDVKELKAKEALSSIKVSFPQTHSIACLKYKDKLQSGISILEEDLTQKNYREKFHHLLCWEELEHDRQLSEMCDGAYMVYFFKHNYIPENLNYIEDEKYVRFGYITSDEEDKGDILSHIKLASQGAFIRLENNNFVHARIVGGRIPKNAHRSAVMVGISEEEHQKLKLSSQFRLNDYKLQVDIKFELKHFYFQQLHRAVDCLPQNVIHRLTPPVEDLLKEDIETSVKVSRPDYECLDLDGMQMKALHVILNSTPKFPILVAGPFGTGKTRMLARAAYEILKRRNNRILVSAHQQRNNRILVCAHHQVSADTFVSYFGAMIEDRNNPWHIQMLRILPNHSYHLNDNQKFKKFFAVATDISWEQIKNKRIIITTLGTVLKLLKIIPPDVRNTFFSDILIDEGAQTREPETISPLAFAGGATRIVIAGDHCQVGPKLLVLGEMAQKHGLGMSLLERMYNIYDKADLPLNKYSVTLLTNYRCHSGILMLPSSLFYQSTLQCRVPDGQGHPEASFPLVFVCSSMDENFCGVSGTNSVEAEVLLEEYKKYFKQWPRNWSSSEKICIMSPSADQCSKLRKMFWKKQSIEILKAYEIQGTEFKAIFLSTSEPTLKNGKCKYETKSICDRYVFNTAITRSKSLVVAVGNPFLLLELENQMVEKYGETARCWTSYIRQCIECETFRYSEKLRKESIKAQSAKLFSMIFDTSVSRSFVSSKPLDGIMKAYKKVFEDIKGCQNTKLLLSSGRGEKLAWKMEDYGGVNDGEGGSDQSNSISVTYPCILDIYKYRKAKAIPLDSSKQIVKIRGLKNRRGAFDGDTVVVGVFEDSPQGKHYGQVREVLKRGSDLKFICKVSTVNPILFYPIDGKNPVFVNLPRLSRDLLRKKEAKDISESDLKYKDVVVFNMLQEIETEDVEEIPIPQIKQVIPLPVAKNMLFLVSFVRWDQKYRYPLGIVENAFPKGYTHFNAERLLKVEHSVSYNDDFENELGFQSFVQEDKSLELFSQVLTIDPEGAQNLDDGLSITEHHINDSGQIVYQLGVHIVNAAKYMKVDTNDDNTAKALGVSVYGGSRGKVMHMISSHELRSKLSLTPGTIKDVISVTCFFTADQSNPRKITIQSVDIKPAQVKSCVQLTYSNAQQILDGQDFHKSTDLFTNIPLFTSIKLLYEVAFAMRLERLQSDAAYAYDISDPGEESCWQAHLLVEELMIWANSEVAKQIHPNFPDTALLRKQPPPNSDKLHVLVDENKSLMMNSLSLSGHLYSEMEIQPSSILVPADVLQELQTALRAGDLTRLSYYLTANRLYPQLASVESELRSISLPAEYCCTEIAMLNSAEYRHSGLNLDKYTHFSSPMRRYFDIQVQRLLLKTFKGSSVGEFSQEQHKDLCISLNAKMQNSRSFEKKINQVELSVEFLSSSKVYSAFVTKDRNKYIELKIPDVKLKHFPKKSLKVFVSHISLSFSIASLNLPNVASILSSKLVSLSTSSSSDSKGIIRAIIAETDSSIAVNNKQEYSCLSCAEYNLFFDDLGTDVPYCQWKEALDIVKVPSPSLTPQDKGRLVKIFKPTSGCMNSKIDLSKIDKKWLYVDCRLEDPWKSPGILKVWLSWSMRDHIISPIVQLVEVSSLARFCVQHCSHPAECFSDPHLLHASRKTYRNIDEYIDLWKRLLLSEAAEKSIYERGSKPVILRNVSLEWPKLMVPKECVNEWYYIPSDYVQIIIPQSFVNECSEFFSIKTGSFVCVRCFNDSKLGSKAVFHFVVHHTDPKKEETIVYIKNIGNSNCRISEMMKKMIDSREWEYEVQVLPMSISYRKVFAGLLNLWRPEVSSRLSQCVAVDIQQLSGSNNYPVQQIKAIFGSELATSISKWSTKSSTKSVTINEVQRQAITLALERPFQLIQGPPGTGKSVTGAHIAYILAMLNKHCLNQRDGHKCVFYCGPSNKSVDVVLEKFSELLEGNTHLRESLKILRIYSSSVEKKDYPDFSNKPLPPSTAKCPTWAKKFALHHLIRDTNNHRDIAESIRKVENKLQQVKSDNKYPSGFLMKEYKEVLKNATKEFLARNQFDIVFCTCNEASGRRAQPHQDSERWVRLFSVRQCIIDESGMAYEPETIVPLRLCEHAVLIGDHKQLQPVIDYGPAKKCGLSISLFERYAVEYKDIYTRTLTTQYRMHKEICEFPSNYFYDEMLITDDSVNKRTNPEAKIRGFWPQGHHMPIVFVNLVGEEDLNRERNNEEVVGIESKVNIMEAQKAIEIAKILHTRHRVPVSEITILTPYSAQKEKINKMVEQEPEYLKNVLVASISESQGNEFGIVILSTVRSQPIAKIRNKHIIQADHIWLRENLGFITDKHQINVGITRSKYGLIIIGNRMLLSYDATWDKLLEHYEERGCIVEGSEFP